MTNSQEDLTNFIHDPKTIEQAVEGSMEKRMEKLGPTSTEELEKILEHLGYEKIVVTKDHREVTKYRHPLGKYHDLSVGFVKALAALLTQQTLEARIDELDHLISIYNLHNEPNGGFKSFGQMTKEDVANLYIAVGERVRSLEAQLKKGQEND